MKLVELFKMNMERKELVNFINNYSKDYESIQSMSECFYSGFKKYSFYEIKRALLNALVKTEVIIEDMEETTLGYYLQDKIALNTKSFTSGTIIHELTHGVQQELGYDFNNYISSENNYKEYRYQHIEYDAFMMGERWSVYATPLRSYIRKQIKKGLAI